LNGGSTELPKKVSTSSKPTKNASIIEKIRQNSTVISIRLNNFGNPEHPPTGLVFDKTGDHVIGKQADSGKIEELEEADIENCLLYAFPFTMPENLDRKFKLDDIKVDALDEILQEKNNFSEDEDSDEDEESED
jgi:hypothetical protein